MDVHFHLSDSHCNNASKQLNCQTWSYKIYFSHPLLSLLYNSLLVLLWSILLFIIYGSLYHPGMMYNLNCMTTKKARIIVNLTALNGQLVCKSVFQADIFLHIPWHEHTSNYFLGAWYFFTKKPKTKNMELLKQISRIVCRSDKTSQDISHDSFTFDLAFVAAILIF